MRATEFIIEGGWASTQTQDTKVTPALIQKMVQVYGAFIDDFNAFLQTKNVPPVRAGIPKGSGTYYKQDLVDNPTKEYGDIDIEFIIPRINGVSEAANESMYFKLVQEFLSNNPTASTKNGVNVIFKLGTQYVQVDLLATFSDVVDWSRGLSPERNIKGVVGMSLYSSLADILNLSIGGRGIQAKLRDNIPVNFRQSKDVSLITIGKNPATWAEDILNFFAKVQSLPNTPTKSPLLQSFPGTDVNDIKLANLVSSIRGLGQSFEANHMFGGKGLEMIQSYDEFMSILTQTYTQKLTSKLTDPKFDKATTPAALEKAANDKKKLQTGMNLVLGYLK